MAIKVKITNDEPEGSQATLAVLVVTVGNLETAEQKHELPAQGSVALQVNAGQFVMVDETQKEGA